MKLDQSGTHSIFGFKFSKLHLRRLYTCIMTLVALSSMVGIAASIASAKYLTDEANSLGQAAAACDASGQPTPQSSLLAAAAAASNRLAGRAFFAQSIGDVVCIALITVMYVVIGPITLIILRGAREFLQSTRANMQQLSPQRSPRLTGDFGRNTSGQLQQRQPAGASVTVRGGSCAASDMVDIAIESALDQHTRYIVSYATVLAAFVIRSLFIIFVAIQARGIKPQLQPLRHLPVARNSDRHMVPLQHVVQRHRICRHHSRCILRQHLVHDECQGAAAAALGCPS